MISGLDSATTRFLTDLGYTTSRLNKAQSQLTSGKRMTVASDDPGQVSSLVELNSDLAMTQQVHTDMGRVKSEVDTAESAVASAVSLLEHARSLAAQGATGTATPEARQSIANELGSMLQQLVSIANTNVSGRYIFSGDSDQIPAYSIDLTQATPVSAYQATASTRLVRDATGSLFPTSKTAQDIFDSPVPGESVFGSLNELRLALRANDQAAIDAASADVRSAGDYLSVQQSFYGTTQNRVNSAMDTASALETRLKTQIGTIADADMIQAASELSDAANQRQVALAARGKVPRSSLFDYLG